jgi:hypothetical protein
VTRVRFKVVWPFLLALFPLLFSACLDGRVKKDFVLAREFNPRSYPVLAVINLDPQVQFSQYVEAELLRKGYKVKEGITVGQLLKKEGFLKEGALDIKSLPKVADLLQVQAIVLCNVMEFSRFRDSYRLGIRCVAPGTGDTLWYAEGAKEGRRGQKSTDLLKEIVAASLSRLPAFP